MTNIKITNMDNGSVIIVTKKLFNSMKNNLSEDSVYEETDEETTSEQLIKTGRQLHNGSLYSFLNTIFDRNEKGAIQ